MKKLPPYFLCIISIHLAATPLNECDRKMLQTFKFEETEPLTLSSFKERAEEAASHGKKYTLAAVKEKKHVFFFDAVHLFSNFEINDNFTNPNTRGAIESIRIYQIPLPFDLATTTFVDELHGKPLEGYYYYMKKHAIDTTDFTGPFKQWGPENLPESFAQLQNILKDHYPISVETYVQAAKDYIQIIRNTNQRLIDEMETSSEPERSERQDILRILNRNTLPIFRRLTQADHAQRFNHQDLLHIYQSYLAILISATGPVAEIKKVSQELMVTGEDEDRAYATEIIKQFYDNFMQIRAEHPTHQDTEFSEFSNDFIAAFPGGTIPLDDDMELITE